MIDVYRFCISLCTADMSTVPLNLSYEATIGAGISTR
jgi:hypothetical protein